MNEKTTGKSVYPKKKGERMSDLDKFKALFNEIGIGYVERNYCPK